MTRTESDALVYVIDFRDSANCSRIESAQPGETIEVLVHPDQEPLSDPLYAKGTRSRNGTLFILEITTADGKHQSLEWEYQLLQLVSQVLQPRTQQT